MRDSIDMTIVIYNATHNNYTTRILNRNDEIDNIIREYIELNPGKTIKKVADYLQLERILSYVPARDRIVDLIEKGITEDRKQGNSFHRLFINDKNDFNKINKQLIEIEKFLDVMHKVIHKINSEPFESPHWDDANIFLYKYAEFLSTIFRILLADTAEKIQSESHSQILYNRIIMLMLKLDSQLHTSNFTTFITFNGDKFEEQFNDGGLKPYLENRGVYTKSANNLRTLFENFKHYILHHYD